MSLKVPPALLDRAREGEVAPEEFVATVRDSLPWAWATVAELAADLHADTAEYAEHRTPPPTEQAWGEMFRAMASDSIRGALEEHFGVRLAFQNCCRIAAFRPDAVGGATYQQFVSPRAQLLNQSPELVNC
jgi:hypothetical protein